MIELSKSNNLRRADMSYENAPVELTTVITISAAVCRPEAVKPRAI